MKKRAVKTFAVVLSVCLLVLCLSPVFGSCHSCSDDDCVICRAVCFVSGLMKTAGALSPLLACAVLTLLVISRKEEECAYVSASNPVEMHTKILS